MRVQFVEVNGIRTRVLYGGAGPALFLLHGIGLTADTFMLNIDKLGESFTVYAPDMPGHGFSDAADFAGEPPQFFIARHLNRLAERLGVTRYSVGGSSFGGLVAALMWFAYPERIDNLIIVGSGSSFHPTNEQEKTLRAAFDNFSCTLKDLTLENVRRRLRAICFDPATVPSEILPVQLTCYALPDRFAAYKATVEGVIASLARPETRILARLEQITARTLILTGREDVRSQWTLHVEACKRMPDATLVIFEKCSHLPYLEQPARFNETVSSFLNGKDVGERHAAGKTVCI